jgi:hypothetical protein
LLIATLLALALAVLPVSGVAMARAQSSIATSSGSCHDMPGDEPMTGDMGRSCAEHCMMQVSPPLAFGAVGAPSIANAVGAAHALLIDSKAPRDADPPETPPPRA